MISRTVGTSSAPSLKGLPGAAVAGGAKVGNVSARSERRAPVTRQWARADVPDSGRRENGSVPRSVRASSSRGKPGNVELQAEAEALRAENLRLQEELNEVLRATELHRQQTRFVKVECDERKHQTEALSMLVERLRRQLRKAEGRSRALEEAAKDLPGPATCSTEGKVEPSGTSTFHQVSPRSPEAEEDVAAAMAGSEETETELEAGPPPPEDTEGDEAQSNEAHSWEFLVQGQLDESLRGNQAHSDLQPKSIACFPMDAMERLRTWGVAYGCIPGRRNGANAAPNQDDFILAMSTPGEESNVALYGVFDGHGPDGHYCAAFVRGRLPELVFGDPRLFSRPQATLRKAFRETRASLLEKTFNVQESGASAAVVLIITVSDQRATRSTSVEGPRRSSERLPSSAHLPSASCSTESETWAFVVQVGRPRAILASRAAGNASVSVVALSPDHRQRGASCEGLMSSFFGGAGVSARCPPGPGEPEVVRRRLRPGVDALLVLATGGLLDILGSREVALRLFQQGVSSPVLRGLCTEAQRRGGSARGSGRGLCDDTTAIAVSLLPLKR